MNAGKAVDRAGFAVGLLGASVGAALCLARREDPACAPPWFSLLSPA